jgi:hypothetical protein
LKARSLKLVFLTACFIVLPFSRVNAQDSIELPEIKGSNSQENQELKIEITGIKRMQAYQPYWYRTERMRGSKGFKISNLYLYDSTSKRYEADLISIHFIGTRSESEFDPKEHDYEFPVIVPKGTQFSAVQLRRFTSSETRPFFVFQNLTFDISKFDW